jgi:hypothetical protein
VHVGHFQPIDVLTEDGAVERWTAQSETVPQHGYRLTLLAPDGREWSTEQGDIFECLLVLRDQVEPLGLRLCCNGARRDAWASGLQRDMGTGAWVYLLTGADAGQRPPQVRTLDPAPAVSVVSVQEQRAWYADWLARRSR